MAFNFQNLEIFLLSLIINDNPGKNIYELDIKSTKKYKKIQKTLSTLIKCITKEKLDSNCFGILTIKFYFCVRKML